MDTQITSITVQTRGVWPLYVNTSGNPDLQWKAEFYAPRTGLISLPFKTRAQAIACSNHVQMHGRIPTMNTNGDIVS